MPLQRGTSGSRKMLLALLVWISFPSLDLFYILTDDVFIQLYAGKQYSVLVKNVRFGAIMCKSKSLLCMLVS